MKNITIHAWAVWNEEGYFDIASTRKKAHIIKKEIESFDIDGLKISKCKIIIEKNAKR